MKLRWTLVTGDEAAALQLRKYRPDWPHWVPLRAGQVWARVDEVWTAWRANYQMGKD